VIVQVPAIDTHYFAGYDTVKYDLRLDRRHLSSDKRQNILRFGKQSQNTANQHLFFSAPVWMLPEIALQGIAAYN
jgi:hypothetical protein